jgi:hypothetical protein
VIFRNSRVAVVAILIGFFLLIPMWRGFDAPGGVMDEGSLLVYPELILKGKLPYRDFETFYGPGNFWVLSVAYALFGTDMLVERAVGLTYRLLILLSIFAIAQRWGAVAAIGTPALMGMLLAFTGFFAGPWIAAMAFALCSLWMIAQVHSRWRCFVGGMFGGMALLCRADFGPALIASALPLFLSMKREGKYRYLAGVGLALLPLGWLMVVVGPAQLGHSLFLFPVFHLNPARRLPLLSAEPYLIYLLCVHLLVSAMNVAAGIVAARTEPTQARGRLLLGAALLGLGLTHYAVQRFDFNHMLFALFLPLSLLPLSILVLLPNKPGTLLGRVRPGLALLLAFIAMQAGLPQFGRFYYRWLSEGIRHPFAREASTKRHDSDLGIFIRRHERSFAFRTEEEASAADNMLAELDRVSSPGQRLFVGPADLRRTNFGDTYIYYLMPQLRPATYFLEMNPFSANAPNSRLASDVQSADWLVLNRMWDYWDEANESAHLGPDAPNAVVREEFDLQGEYGLYLLYRNKRLH